MSKGLHRLACAAAAIARAGLPACNTDSNKADKKKDVTDGKGAAQPRQPDPQPTAQPKPDKPASTRPALAPAAERNPALLDPSKATEQAPATFRARFETTKGTFVIEVVREWSPNGADRFYNLVKMGFFDGVTFFRVVKGFMAQFGIHGEPEVAQKWMTANIEDDPVVKSNTRSFVTYAKSNAPNSRSTQFFINYSDKNSVLDRQGFSPFGKVVEGMEVVDSFEGKYGEQTTSRQGEIYQFGNSWLDENFPGLDYIVKATLVEDAAGAAKPGDKKAGAVKLDVKTGK